MLFLDRTAGFCHKEFFCIKYRAVNRNRLIKVIFKISVIGYRISRNIDSDFNLAIWRTRQDRQINLRHYRSIYNILQAWVSLHTELKSTNLKSHQQRFLSKPPNIMFAKYNVHQYFCLYGIFLHSRLA